jgi:succinate dehydrogenase / fumarate reductase flavoprotein subunit
MPEFTEVATDVLVIGSGSAGSMAAIRAHTAGVDTLVVTKGPWPSGNSTKALAGYAAAFGHADPRDNPDVHFADVVRNGIGLCNQRLVRKWVNSICGLTEEMRGWGLDLIRNGDKYHQIPWEGHTYPRMVCHHRVTGKYLMKRLGERSEQLGIKALAHTIVGGLFLSDGRASGAWALNYRTGELYLIRCKSIIVCTGGLGAMYPIGDNVGAVTGEGYSLAYEAGVELTGMEFGHFLAAPIHPAKMQVKFVFIGFVNGLLNEGGARLYNGRGERFMRRYDGAQGELRHSSEELSRRISQEIVEGRAGAHGGIYFDVSDVPDTFRSNERYQRMYELADRAGMDLRREPIELTTYPHDLVGGIKIDEFGRTNVPGLYAAGEAAGGSHGASRFGGSALSDCLVYGSASGTDAAKYARQFRQHMPLESSAVAAAKDKIGRWSREQGAEPGEALRQLSRMAFEHLNMVRSESGLNSVLNLTRDIASNALPEFAAGRDSKARPAKLREAIEAEGQSTLCDIIARAALERKESRGGFFGGHYRIEHPERDDAGWLKTITVRKERGKPTIRHEAPVALEDLSQEILDVMATSWRPPDDPTHWSEAE